MPLGSRQKFLEQFTNETSQLLCKGFPEKSLPRNASRQAFACRKQAFQVLNALEQFHFEIALAAA
ncbi:MULTISPECIES: hypothetical protein [unclassified Desulfovibrio]|uniref:hypothetical protein n=1 Tax=unclassified Desulfovibrio TaxID=2593640 RepID=UPI002FDB03BE